MNKLAACLLILSSTGIAQDGLVLDAALLDGTNGSILHTTPRQECRGVIITGNDRVFTLGVESDGSNLLNETRQFVSLAAWKDDHWVRLGSVSDSGYAYSPAAAPDGRNGLWIAWAQFNAIARDWDIYARHYDGQQFGETTRVSSNRGPDLRPAITFAAGAPLIVWEEGVAWEAGAAGSMQIASATLENGRWQESKVTSGAGFNFRPFLAVASGGKVWLAWDRWVSGDYDTYISSMEDGRWSDPAAFFAGPNDEQRPSLRAARDGTVWVQAGKRAEGFKGAARVKLAPAAQQFVEGMQQLDEFTIDPSGRMWFFEQTQAAADAGNTPPYWKGPHASPGETRVGWFDGRRMNTFTLIFNIGYRAPVFDRERLARGLVQLPRQRRPLCRNLLLRPRLAERRGHPAGRPQVRKVHLELADLAEVILEAR